jgi:hypothetical protein
MTGEKMKRVLLILTLLAAPLYAQEQEYVSRLVDCYAGIMEIPEEFHYDLYFIDTDTIPGADTWFWVEPMPEYRYAAIFVDNRFGALTDKELRETMVHELQHIVWMDPEWELYRSLMANLLGSGMPYEQADRFAWDEATRIFHHVIVRVERWDIWQRTCTLEELY